MTRNIYDECVAYETKYWLLFSGVCLKYVDNYVNQKLADDQCWLFGFLSTLSQREDATIFRGRYVTVLLYIHRALLLWKADPPIWKKPMDYWLSQLTRTVFVWYLKCDIIKKIQLCETNQSKAIRRPLMVWNRIRARPSRDIILTWLQQ